MLELYAGVGRGVLPVDARWRGVAAEHCDALVGELHSARALCAAIIGKVLICAHPPLGHLL